MNLEWVPKKHEKVSWDDSLLVFQVCCSKHFLNSNLKRKFWNLYIFVFLDLLSIQRRVEDERELAKFAPIVHQWFISEHLFIMQSSWEIWLFWNSFFLTSCTMLIKKTKKVNAFEGQFKCCSIFAGHTALHLAMEQHGTEVNPLYYTISSLKKKCFHSPLQNSVLKYLLIVNIRRHPFFSPMEPHPMSLIFMEPHQLILHLQQATSMRLVVSVRLQLAIERTLFTYFFSF